MDERERKELSRFVGSAVRRIKEASVGQYEKGMRTFMLVAANYERMILASFLRGVLDEVEVDRHAAQEIERMVKAGEYVPARQLMVLAINQKIALSVHMPASKVGVPVVGVGVVEQGSGEAPLPAWVTEIESKMPRAMETDLEFEGEDDAASLPEEGTAVAVLPAFHAEAHCELCRLKGQSGKLRLTPSGPLCDVHGGGPPTVLIREGDGE
ncbi:MAG: hypothetical protein ACYDH4_11465 [Candidatus Cryosericum sp.]